MPGAYRKIGNGAINQGAHNEPHHDKTQVSELAPPRLGEPELRGMGAGRSATLNSHPTTAMVTRREIEKLI